MKRIIPIIALLALLCGCLQNEEQPTEASAEETASESITVTFARTEPSETSAPAAPETEETTVLKENQLEYRDKNIAVLMEFTGVESLMYYPHALIYPEYRDTDYVLHSVFTVENLSETGFDFIAQKMIIRCGGNSSMMPVTADDTGLVTSDKYYSIEPGENVTFNIDFVGDKESIERAEEILYAYVVNYNHNNFNYKELNNVTAAKDLDITERAAVKKAVRCALEITENAPPPFQFVPSDGDYTINTEKNSYCINVEKIRPDGYVCDYIRVDLQVRSLVGAQVFEPNKFQLVRAGGKLIHPDDYSFDEALVSSPKPCETVIINGEEVIFYDYPFNLYLHPDNTAEYSFYYSCNEDDEFYGFIYDGENDSFEKGIEVK